MGTKENKKRHIISLIGLFVIFSVIISHIVHASEGAINGLELAKKVFERDVGKDSKARMVMILRRKNGRERVRQFEALALDDGTTRYSLIRFLSPKDIKGTAFLNISHEDGTTEQYLYLPALGRARRIAGSVKKRRFVNSDFTYEDLERRSPQKDTHQIICDDSFLGKPCWVLESIPKKGTRSQYSKIVQWITKDGYVPVKTRLFNKKGKLAKEFIVHSMEQIQGIWTVMDATMVDLIKKRETQVKVNQIEYNVGLSKNLFRVKAMGQ